MFTRAGALFTMLFVCLVGLPSLAIAQGGASVTGTVTYRTRNLLPPTAVVTVQLVDVSRADAPADVLATQVIEPKGGAPPYPFALSYDPAVINQANSYAVQAAIRDGDQLLFITTQRYSVITRGGPTSGIELVVEPVAQTPAGPPQRVTIESPAEDTLVGSPVTITGRAARFPTGGTLRYRFRDEAGRTLGEGALPVEGDFRGTASFNASLGFTLPGGGGVVRAEVFERDSSGRELGLASRALFVSRPPSITLTSPTPETVVSSPVLVEGSLGRLPLDARLRYRVLASDGRLLGAGDFPVPGAPGRPALFRGTIPFEASPEGDRVTVQLFDQDPATGQVFAQADVILGVAPQPQRITITSPGANAYVGTPLVVTGRTVRFPTGGVLGYAIYDGFGAQIGGGVFPVAGSLAVGGTFNVALGFNYPQQGGPLRLDLYDQDPATGQFRATASLNLRSVPLQQQIVIESPAPGTRVGVPAVITGRTARYPSGGVLQYRVFGPSGEQLGAGRFGVQGPAGEPASFNAALSFNPPAFAGGLRAEIFEQDQFGNALATVVLDLSWGGTSPGQRQIVIETPPSDTLVGSPVVITGRANFFPFEGTLSYRVRDAVTGLELGTGSAQARAEAGGARFVISAAFRPLRGGGTLIVDVYAVDQATGGEIARASVRLRQAP